MSDDLKVINLLSDTPKVIEDILGFCNADITSDAGAFNDAKCILVDSLESIEELEISGQIICVTDEEVLSTIDRDNISLISKRFLDTEVGAVIFKSIVTGSSSIHLGKAFEGVVLKNKIIRVTNPLLMGGYSDSILSFAFDNKFDFVGVRNFMGAISSFFHYLSIKEVIDYPVEIDYGISKDSLLIRFYASGENFFLEHVLESFNRCATPNPYLGLMGICRDQCHALDIYTLEKTDKVVITGVWIKDYEHPSSVSISNIKLFKNLDTNPSELVAARLEFLEPEVNLSGESPEGGPEEYPINKFDKASNIASLRRLSQFVQNSIDGEEKEDVSKREGDSVNDGIGGGTDSDGESKAVLNREVIAKHLDKFYDKEMIESLTSDDIELLVKVLLNKKAMEELYDMVTTVRNSIDEDEYVQKISAHIENLAKEEIAVIKGVGDSTEKDWEGKKIKMAEQAKDTAKANPLSSHEEIEEEVVQIVSGNMGISEEASKKVFGVLDSAATSDAVDEVMKVTPQELKTKKENTDLKKILGLRDKIIEGLHNKVSSLEEKLEKEEEATLVKGSDDQDNESEKIVGSDNGEEIEKSRKKDKKLEKLQNDIAELEVKNNILNRQLRFSKTDNFADNEGKINSYEKEIDDLKDIISTKDSELKSNSDNQNTDSNYLKQLESLNSKLLGKEEEINKYKQDFKVLEQKVKAINRKNEDLERKIQESNSGSDKALADRDNKIKILNDKLVKAMSDLSESKKKVYELAAQGNSPNNSLDDGDESIEKVSKGPSKKKSA